jgi:hypothetical protein
MNINSKTTLKSIISEFDTRFGLVITQKQAREIKDTRKSCYFMGSKFVNTTLGFSVDIAEASERGVKYSTYGTWYPRNEWNKAVRAGEFN